MSVARKPLALAAGALIALMAAALPSTRAQQPAGRSGVDTIVIDDATVDWIERSEVAALIEGNVESIELDLGKMVRKGDPIGVLNRNKARLTVAKAQVAANGGAAKEKAEAQYDQALGTLARIERMLNKDRSIVPREEVDKARAEMKVTQAMIKEAEENQALAKAELDLAKNQLDEHTIRAPFTGMVIKRMKHPGESVNAREAVVELGNLDKLRVYAFIPLEHMQRVHEGTLVELQARIHGTRSGFLPVEQKKLRGKVTFLDPQVQAINETAVRIYADFDNSSRELSPGMKGSLTIFLDAPNAAARGVQAAAEPVVPASATAPAAGTDLPPLPR